MQAPVERWIRFDMGCVPSLPAVKRRAAVKERLRENREASSGRFRESTSKLEFSGAESGKLLLLFLFLFLQKEREGGGGLHVALSMEFRGAL